MAGLAVMGAQRPPGDRMQAAPQAYQPRADRRGRTAARQLATAFEPGAQPPVRKTRAPMMVTMLMMMMVMMMMNLFEPV